MTQLWLKSIKTLPNAMQYVITNTLIGTNEMAAVKEVELIVPQGATFIYEITYKDPDTDLPINLTGYSARLQIREKVDSSTIIYSALSTGVNPAIIITGGSGLVVLTIPANTTRDFVFRKAAFDLEIESSTGVVTRLVKGTMILDKEVTR